MGDAERDAEKIVGDLAGVLGRPGGRALLASALRQVDATRHLATAVRLATSMLEDGAPVAAPAGGDGRIAEAAAAAVLAALADRGPVLARPDRWPDLAREVGRAVAARVAQVGGPADLG